ncbi:hypothetical protein HJC23_008744 [Cyclotella cryptica]|uniref:Uncharacterized protein n=1 Tax=Cyclotella cryptica TaxID=29204 RepID=A0ABD3PEU0_9STRA
MSDITTKHHLPLPVHRRKLKSALFFACWPAVLTTLLLLLSSISTATAFATRNNKLTLLQRRHEWIGKSVQYYSTVMRKNKGIEYNDGMQQTAAEEATMTFKADNEPFDPDFVGLATKHYYARFLIKKGKWSSAEKIYRRIIDELGAEEQCDNTKLAVSTLLLALHMQRTGDIKATRAVFLNFFRRVALAHEKEEEVHKCSCSAKVLQAYALFEMKNGHSAKSLEIIRRAVKMDEGLSPVLGWKQFRDAAAGRRYTPSFSFRRSGRTGDDVKP